MTLDKSVDLSGVKFPTCHGRGKEVPSKGPFRNDIEGWALRSSGLRWLESYWDLTGSGTG
jgi:hypothetical protein